MRDAATARLLRRGAVLAGLAATLVLPGRAAAGAVVRVDQVGYAPGDAKRALVYSSVAETGATFAVVTPTGTPVLAGSLAAPVPPGWSTAFPFVYALDLSRISLPNRYHVVVRGPAPATSLPFRIADRATLFGPLARNALGFVRQQRDGADAAGVPGRGASHLADRSATAYAPPRYSRSDVLQGPLRPVGGPVDVAGGWFDGAGYVKTVAAATTTDLALWLALRDHEAVFGSQAPALREEARRGADWLLKAFDDTAGLLLYQVGLPVGNGSTVLGEQDAWRLPEGDDRLAVPAGSPSSFLRRRPAFRAGLAGAPLSPNLAGRLAAALGLCAQVEKGVDDDRAARCLHAGLHAYALADPAPEGALLSVSPPGPAPEREWRDDLELGAAELARALGPDDPQSAPLLTAAQASLQRPLPLDAGDLSALADAELYRALPDGSPGRVAAITALQRVLQAPSTLADGDGALRAASAALAATLYARLTGSTRFDAGGQQQLDWLLGANPWGSSFVVGAGSVFPRCLASPLANLHGGTILGAVVSGPQPPDELVGLTMPRGARACPAGGVDRFAPFAGGGLRYRDDVRAWPTDEPSTAAGALTLLLFAERAA